MMRACLPLLLAGCIFNPYGWSNERRDAEIAAHIANLEDAGQFKRLGLLQQGRCRVGTTTVDDFRIWALRQGYEIKRENQSVSAFGISETYRMKPRVELDDAKFHNTLYGTHYFFSGGVLSGWTKGS